MLARRLQFLGALVLLPAAALATCSDEPTGPADAQGDVSGAVALVKTGAGVRDVIAVLQQDGHVVAAAPSDEAGTFRFGRVAAGQYTVRLTGLELSGISLRHVSFEPVVQEIQVSGAPIEVLFAGAGLVPGRIVGDVTCGGAPVSGVALRVVGGQTDVTVQSNEQGRYAATDLDHGSYAVLVPAPPPGCSFPVAWSVATVNVGQSVEVDFAGTM